MKKYILAFDQGTTSSRAIVFNHDGLPVATAQKEFTQIYPNPGWVEHVPDEIWSTQAGMGMEALSKAGITANHIGIGITNQRETAIVSPWHFFYFRITSITGISIGGFKTGSCKLTD